MVSSKIIGAASVSTAVVLCLYLRHRKRKKQSAAEAAASAERLRSELPLDLSALPAGWTPGEALQPNPSFLVIPLLCPIDGGETSAGAFIVLHDLYFSPLPSGRIDTNTNSDESSAVSFYLTKLCPFFQEECSGSNSAVKAEPVSASLSTLFTHHTATDSHLLYWSYKHEARLVVSLAIEKGAPALDDERHKEELVAAVKANPEWEHSLAAEATGRLHYLSSALNVHLTLPPWFSCKSLDNKTGCATLTSQRCEYRLANGSKKDESPSWSYVFGPNSLLPQAEEKTLYEACEEEDRGMIHLSQLVPSKANRNNQDSFPSGTPSPNSSSSPEGGRQEGGFPKATPNGIDSSDAEGCGSTSSLTSPNSPTSAASLLLGNRFIFHSDALGLRFSLLVGAEVVESRLTIDPTVVYYPYGKSTTDEGRPIATLRVYETLPPGWCEANRGRNLNKRGVSDEPPDEEALLHDVAVNFTDYSNRPVPVRPSTLSGVPAAYFDIEWPSTKSRMRTIVCPYDDRLYTIQWECAEDRWSAELPVLRRLIDGFNLSL